MSKGHFLQLSKCECAIILFKDLYITLKAKSFFNSIGEKWKSSEENFPRDNYFNVLLFDEKSNSRSGRGEQSTSNVLQKTWTLRKTKRIQLKSQNFCLSDFIRLKTTRKKAFFDSCFHCTATSVYSIIRYWKFSFYCIFYSRTFSLYQQLKNTALVSCSLWAKYLEEQSWWLVTTTNTSKYLTSDSGKSS